MTKSTKRLFTRKGNSEEKERASQIRFADAYSGLVTVKACSIVRKVAVS